MAFTLERRIVAVTTIASLAAATLVYFGTGIHPLWPCLWLAPLPLLLLAPRLSAARAFAAAALAWLLGSLNMARYFRNVLGTSGKSAMIGFLAMALPACVFALGILLSRALARRGRPIGAALALPVAWVTYEYVSMLLSPHGTFGNIAYSQMDALPVLQLASLTGVWGISFAVFFFPAVLAVLLDRRHAARDRAVLAVAATAVFVAVILFGAWRLQTSPEARTARVLLLASDARENVSPQEPGPDSARLYSQYLDAAMPLARTRADVVVLPEKIGVAVPETLAADDARFRAFANETRSDVIAGMIRIARLNRFNEARVYSSSNPDVLAYDKQHLLPAFESKMTPGARLTTISRSSGVWGVAICKDLDFPSLGREYGAKGVGLLLVPAWDFVDDAWLHDRMAVMRGVESGFSIARAAKEGLLTVSDSRGRVLAEKASNAARFSTLLANAPVVSVSTPYRRRGDWFAWLSIAAAISLIVLAVRHRAEDAAGRTAT